MSFSSPLPQLPARVTIAADAPGSDTAHLQPVIDFLKAQGNTPATGDAFEFNRDGLGVYGFAQPLDTLVSGATPGGYGHGAGASVHARKRAKGK